MQLSQLMLRYGISHADVDTIARAMGKNSSLSDIVRELDNVLTPAQVFSVCKSYCLEELGDSIINVAPGIANDRDNMKTKSDDEILKQRTRGRIMCQLRNIEDDFLAYLSEME